MKCIKIYFESRSDRQVCHRGSRKYTRFLFTQGYIRLQYSIVAVNIVMFLILIMTNIIIEELTILIIMLIILIILIILMLLSPFTYNNKAEGNLI